MGPRQVGRRWVVQSVCVGIVCVSAPLYPAVARAQANSARGASDLAAALVDRGVELRRGGDDVAALRVLREAEALGEPSARLLVHLAAVHQALGDWVLADRYLRDALQDPGDPYILRHQEDLESVRQVIDRQIATLDVHGRPQGAEVLLNGRVVGTVPLHEPLRILGGVYTLEIRHPGYYASTRSLALPGGMVSRERVALSELAPAVAAVPPAAGVLDRKDSGAGSPTVRWLPWTLTGLGVATAGASVALWANREKHARRWNDNSRCQGNGLTRGEACAEELDAGQRAETLLYVGVAATGALALSATYHFLAGAPERSGELEAGLSCMFGAMSLGCHGRF